MPPSNISLSIGWNVIDSKWGVESSSEVNEVMDENMGVRDNLRGNLLSYGKLHTWSCMEEWS